MTEAFTFENVYNAYLYTRNGKRDKQCVINYELHSLEATNYLTNKLQNRSYKLGDYFEFKVYEPKERIVKAPPFRDRVVQRCICEQILLPAIDKRLIYDTYACRIDKGTHAGLYRLEDFLRKHYIKHGAEGWIIKGDISKYFYSIDHEILKEKLYPLIKEYDMKWLLDQIIDSTDNPGIPLGNQSSQWFANFYLNGFDHFVKEVLRVKYYIRYMDDWVAILPTKQEAKDTLNRMENYLWYELKLETNNKTQIFPIKNGVDFLGFHTYITDTGKVIRKIRSDSKKRMQRKLKYFKIKYQNGEMTKEQVTHSYNSWVGHAKHGNCYHLIQEMNELYNEIFEGDG